MTQNLAFHLEKTLANDGAERVEFYDLGHTGRENFIRRSPILWASTAGLLALALCGGAFAQPSLGSSDTVAWSASAPAQGVKPGGRVKVTLRGAVQNGWHVYGLEQLPDGPTPLRVTLDVSDVAAADGAPAGSPVTKLQDPSFNLQTQFYEHDFTVTAPVRISAHAAAGAQVIPVNVRFQTCNGRICQPPKTVKLSVPITVQANG